MSLSRDLLKPAIWLFYAVFVLEILFMISPAALYFYAGYGPILDAVRSWPATSWLTQFFLPHFSDTGSWVLNGLHPAAGLFIILGAVLFLTGAVPVYWSKIRGNGAVTGGVYAVIRHPQYAGLAVLGLGAMLLWPRFLVLVSYLTMSVLYVVLIHWEEKQCVAKFGTRYVRYRETTGMLLPRMLSSRLLRLWPAGTPPGRVAAGVLLLGVSAASIALAFALRDWSLSQISAHYTGDVAVLSPARLDPVELQSAYALAMADARVQAAIERASARKLIVHVVPADWYLPDLPIEPPKDRGPHRTPEAFDRRNFKILVSRPRMRDSNATGKGIVASAYGIDPIVTVRVDLTDRAHTSVETPPAHVVWGDIPTPIF